MTSVAFFHKFLPSLERVSSAYRATQKHGASVRGPVLCRVVSNVALLGSPFFHFPTSQEPVGVTRYPNTDPPLGLVEMPRKPSEPSCFLPFPKAFGNWVGSFNRSQGGPAFEHPLQPTVPAEVRVTGWRFRNA